MDNKKRQFYYKTTQGKATIWKRGLTASDMRKRYYEEMTYNREIGRERSKVISAKAFEAGIANGQVTMVEEYLESLDLEILAGQSGCFSKDPLRNSRYLSIIVSSFAIRATIEGGVLEEEANTLGDVYIQKMDEADSIYELEWLFKQLVMELTKSVASNKENEQDKISEPIKEAMSYINRNLNQTISLKDLADYVALSETYFCSRFKKETGMTISKYTQKTKIKEAMNLLKFSNRSLLEISDLLGFCSQSHFSSTFNKQTGMTPKNWRQEHGGVHSEVGTSLEELEA